MLAKSTALALLLGVGSVSAAAVYAAETVVKEEPDFGLCIPTIKYEGGLGQRSATEFSFLPADPLCARGQQNSLNPNIITNRICDQLTTVCSANDAAKALCRQAQAKIRVLGTHDKSTADTWNTLLGFGGALTNPDGGASEPGAVRDLKKRDINAAEKRAFVPCSTSVWLENCNGWPDVEPVVKRSEEAAPVVKREAEPEPEPEAAPIAKRDVQPEGPLTKKDRLERDKRQIKFIPCSTEEWIDDCTGWP